jgi:hypothetical protein
MPNVQNEHWFVEHDEQNPIGSAIAAAIKKLSDRLVKRSALRREVRAFGVLRECLDLLSRARHPSTGSLGRAPMPDEMIGLSEILLRLRRNYDPIHPAA